MNLLANLIKPILFIFIVMSIVHTCAAQNLIPNGSFEEYSDCPSTNSLIELSNGWFSARGTCDYYNACDDPCDLSVPCNVGGWQEALNGSAYAGFVGCNVPELTYREHLSIALTQALTIGETYYFSMYVNNGIVLEQSPNKASNGQGAFFTTVEHGSLYDANPINNPSPLLNDPHIINHEVINDSTNWVQVKGSFIADSAYTYVVLGAFLDSSLIEVVNVSGIGPFENNGEAYYFVDEVRLSTDSIYAYEDLVTSIAELEASTIRLYPNPATETISIEGIVGVKSIAIFDQSARLVMERSVMALSELVLDIAQLPPGLYLMRFTLTDGQQVHERVVKSYM